MDIEHQIKLRPRLSVPANPLILPIDAPADSELERNSDYRSASKLLVKYNGGMGLEDSDIWEYRSTFASQVL
jgi:hypothetical protein